MVHVGTFWTAFGFHGAIWPRGKNVIEVPSFIFIELNAPGGFQLFRGSFHGAPWRTSYKTKKNPPKNGGSAKLVRPALIRIVSIAGADSNR